MLFQDEINFVLSSLLTASLQVVSGGKRSIITIKPQQRTIVESNHTDQTTTPTKPHRPNRTDQTTATKSHRPNHTDQTTATKLQQQYIDLQCATQSDYSTGWAIIDTVRHTHAGAYTRRDIHKEGHSHGGI